MNEKITYQDFESLVSETHPGEHIRKGQHWFNTLHRVRPDLSRAIHMTQNDPFHRDSILENARAFVTKNW